MESVVTSHDPYAGRNGTGFQIAPPDPIEQALDELALLGAAYLKNRDANRPVGILRRAMIDACQDVIAFYIAAGGLNQSFITSASSPAPPNPASGAAPND